ncbi:hypothetical protein GCM10027449_05710 [Sinomonas notoginsengisoli]|uniref:hypothetical protein n=1 Tax=Sinomonas notoginsengisoli TaxID=1457311 RepID=UPI001F470E46|nr:hypothetical protein [Sinomonas notoginsengisoli]
MPEKHRVLDTFMRVAERAEAVWGPAAHSDPEAPIVHRHDAFEQASEDELRSFEVETDSEGHHYAVRKGEPAPRRRR